MIEVCQIKSDLCIPSAVCIIGLPMGLLDDKGRLDCIKESLKRQQELGLPGAMSKLMWVYGSLPGWLLVAGAAAPVALSNVAGPINEAYFNGHPITSFYPTGLGQTDIGKLGRKLQQRNLYCRSKSPRV